MDVINQEFVPSGHGPAISPPIQRPLADELQDLASAIAADGIARHNREIVRLGLAASEAGLPTALIAALMDPTAAPVMRERAAARLSLVALTAPARIDVTAPVPSGTLDPSCMTEPVDRGRVWHEESGSSLLVRLR